MINTFKTNFKNIHRIDLPFSNDFSKYRHEIRRYVSERDAKKAIERMKLAEQDASDGGNMVGIEGNNR